MNRIRRIIITFAAVGVAAVALGVSVSMASTHKSAVASNAELTVKHTALGNALADGSGRTLYLFQADKPNVSVLSRAGFSVWPAFAANRKPRAAGGVNAARIGAIAAPGGARQVT